MEKVRFGQLSALFGAAALWNLWSTSTWSSKLKLIRVWRSEKVWTLRESCFIEVAIAFWTHPECFSSKKIQVNGLISAASFGSGRTNSDRQYYYLNGRPFVATKVSF